MRRRTKNRCITILIAAVCAVSAFSAVIAANPQRVKAEEYWPQMPEISSPSAIVMEVNTGTVLYEKNSHDQHYPASITKIMTTMLAIANCSLDETVVFSYDAVFGGNEGDTSHIARDYQEELTMEQCLYAIMLESANECSYAVAEHVAEKNGGDYSSFIDMMNEKAASLGCTDTHFNNCNGLPDTEHWTSAYDMALIGAAAYQSEIFRTISSATSFTIPATNKHDEPYYCHNHHKMIYPWKGDAAYLYDYCTGGKTGYTDAAGSTLVTFAEKDGLTLVCVIMNAHAPNQYVDTRTLFDYSFDNFQALNIATNETHVTNEAMDHAGVLNNNEAFVKLDSSAYIILPKLVDFSEAAYTLDTADDDNLIAELSYTYAGRSVGTAGIVMTGATAEEAPFVTEPEEVDPDLKVVEVKPAMILAVLLIVVAVVILVYLGKRLFDNFYIIRHNFMEKREQRARFRATHERKRKNRKRDRLFR
jgi:D-alanyl-D-alanine carboxypeptidase